MNKKISSHKTILSGNSGSAIVIAMLTLLVVTIIGLSTIDNSITEKTIATNDILYKQSFAAADGGTQIAIQLIEETLRCGGMLSQNTSNSTTNPTNPLLFMPGDLNIETGIEKIADIAADNNFVLGVLDRDFAMDGNNLDVTNTNGPNDSKRDISFAENAPLSYDDDVPHTNIAVIEKPLKGRVGFSVLMAEGYSGLGKSAGGNIIKPYDIHSRNEYRARNSCSHIVIEYSTDGKCGKEACPCAYQ